MFEIRIFGSKSSESARHRSHPLRQRERDECVEDEEDEEERDESEWTRYKGREKMSG